MTRGFIAVLFAVQIVRGITLTSLLPIVNPEWRARPELNDPALNVPFEYREDADIVAKHLELVEAALAARDVSSLPPAQQRSRARLLRELHEYRLARAFPHNWVLPYRTPVFIDPAGNYCAVGYLMAQSGMRALAEEVRTTNNFVHVRDINDARFLDWARSSGFTIDELALIQPGYGEYMLWKDLGTDLGTEITCMVADTVRRRIFVGGTISSIDGSGGYGNIAMWNGQSWFSPGGGVDGPLTAVALYHGDVIAAGRFSHAGGVAVKNIARWDGTSWHAMAGGVAGEVHAMCVFHDSLVIAGGFATVDTSAAHHLAMWSGTVWNGEYGTFDGPVNALAVRGDSLFVGGEFFHTGSAIVNHVARLSDGAWSGVGGGLVGTVHALTVFDGKIFAGGDFVTEVGDSAFGFAQWNAGRWTDSIDYAAHVRAEITGSKRATILSFAVVDSEVYHPSAFIAAAFEQTSATGRILHVVFPVAGWAGMLPGDNFTRSFDSTVSTLLFSNKLLYAGGTFRRGLSVTDFTIVPVIEPGIPNNVVLSITPHPVHGDGEFRFASVEGAAVFVVTDAVGHQVFKWYGVSDRVTVPTSGWVPGLYAYSLDRKGVVSHGTFVVR